MHAFRMAVLRTTGRLVSDRSFVIVEAGRPIGLAPLVRTRDFCSGQVWRVMANTPSVADGRGRRCRSRSRW